MSTSPEPTTSSGEAVPSSSRGSAAPAPKAKPPWLDFAPIEGMASATEGEYLDVHTLSGAVMVTTRLRAGRVTAHGIEWVGQIPKRTSELGDNFITGVFGVWPEELAVSFQNEEGRSSQPTYFPLVGGGGWARFGEGASGVFAGAARSGETTTVAGFAPGEGARIIKVRGPFDKPTMTRAEMVGCEQVEDERFGARVAVSPWGYAATRAGTVILAGLWCKNERRIALEIWRTPKEPGRIVVPEAWSDSEGVGSLKLLQGPGDTLYIVPPAPERAILRYRDGDLGVLPALPFGHQAGFVSPTGTLYAHDGRTLFELVGESWVARAVMAWPMRYGTLARLGDRFVRGGTTIEALTKPSTLAIDPEADTTACATPFVYLDHVAPDVPSRFAFPDEQNVLASFAAKAKVHLVRFEHEGGRLGVAADDWKTAKALWRHLREATPKRDVRTICYAPSNAREVPLAPEPKAATETKR